MLKGNMMSSSIALVPSIKRADLLICFYVSVISSAPQLNLSFNLTLPKRKKIPIPTFILGPSRAELDHFIPDLKGCELCPNLTYLGDHGIFTGNSGLKLAYISGKQKQDINHKSGFSMDSIKSLEVQIANGHQSGVDILLTSQWPKGVENGAASLNDANSEKFGSALLARLAQNIKPRYHFSGIEGIHYERAPYRNHEVLQEKTQHVSRFIALAKVGNPKKLKWLYAFNINPLIKMPAIKLNEQPAGTTPCPYACVVQEQNTADQRKEALSNQYFYDVSADVMSGNTRRGVKRQHQERTSRPPPKPMGPCWFCLSSPEVEKHLVVSVGEHCYIALPKGTLVPEHVLILPIGHYQSSIDLPEEAMEEVEKFKTAIAKALRSQGKSAVFFERSFKSPHLQIQCVAIPSEKENLAREIFLEMASMQSITLDELPDHAELRQVVRPGSPYFLLELPQKQRFICNIRGRFPLQFGREVLAHQELLNCAERIDWKNCPSSRDLETKETTRFRKLFQPFDFTI